MILLLSWIVRSFSDCDGHLIIETGIRMKGPIMQSNSILPRISHRDLDPIVEYPTYNAKDTSGHNHFENVGLI